MKIRNELIAEARELAKKTRLSEECSVGDVTSVLITDKHTIYKGICINCVCGIGFCAEHSAIANMLTSGESRIKKIVAVSHEGKILPPCGRCRELILQINDKNKETEVIIDEDKIVKLEVLLPERWQERFR